jgi:hypothetical protein
LKGRSNDFFEFVEVQFYSRLFDNCHAIKTKSIELFFVKKSFNAAADTVPLWGVTYLAGGYYQYAAGSLGGWDT